MATMNQDNAAYQTFVEQLKEVASGARGWVSISRAAKAIRIDRAQLEVVAKSLNLTIVKQGRYGVCASR